MYKKLLIISLAGCLTGLQFASTAMAETNNGSVSSYALTTEDLGADLHGPSTPVKPVAPVTAPIQTVASQPDLGGFQLSFSKQPLLTQHGAASAEITKNQAIAYQGTVAQVLQKILPYGWHVYIKSHLGDQMGFPVMINGKGKPWITNLKNVLKQAGLHGAVWWGPQVLTLWSAPAMPSYQPKPDLQNFSPANLNSVGTSLSTKSAAPAASHSAAAPRANLLHDAKASKVPVGSAINVTSSNVALASANPPKPIVPSLAGVTPVFILNRGDLILPDLQKWAKQSSWKVVWQVPEDWQVPNTTTFSGDFQKAASQLIQALSANGANIHAVFHTANNTVVISGAGGGE